MRKGWISMSRMQGPATALAMLLVVASAHGASGPVAGELPAYGEALVERLVTLGAEKGAAHVYVEGLTVGIQVVDPAEIQGGLAGLGLADEALLKGEQLSGAYLKRRAVSLEGLSVPERVSRLVEAAVAMGVDPEVAARFAQLPETAPASELSAALEGTELAQEERDKLVQLAVGEPSVAVAGRQRHVAVEVVESVAEALLMPAGEELVEHLVALGAAKGVARDLVASLSTPGARLADAALEGHVAVLGLPEAERGKALALAQAYVKTGRGAEEVSPDKAQDR